MTQRNEFFPNYASPPSDTLIETMEHLSMDIDGLAKKMKLSQRKTYKVIADMVTIDQDIAMRLQNVFGVPASFWLNRQQNYIRTMDRLKGCK